MNNPVPLGSISIGGALPALIMGPCVIESEEHCLRMAEELAAASAEAGLPFIFKASFDKANRSSHKSYRGPGLEQGLDILAKARERCGAPVTTDVHETCQVERCAAVVDLLQIPALLCRQSDLVLACGNSGRPTSIKKGQFLAPWDAKQLVDKFQTTGNPNLILIERGSSFGYNTLVSDLRSLPIMRGLGVPVIYDGTHSVQAPGSQGSCSGGAGHLAPAMMRAALAVGVEGLFLEVHDQPEQAKSDGPNMLSLGELPAFLRDVKAIHQALGRPGVPTPRT